METASFNVHVSNETFKFNAAHFVAFDGYRERLHGHNYRMGVRLEGHSTSINRDGYVIDFGYVKQVCRRVCKRMNEHFLCPMYSDVLVITENEDSIHIQCQDGSVFLFPRQDCLLLPIVHATAEEIVIYLWSELLEGFHSDYLMKRGIHTMEVTVAEAPGQEATFRFGIADAVVNGSSKIDVRAFITRGELVPMPCLLEEEGSSTGRSSKDKTTTCCPNCQDSTKRFSEQLERIAAAINNGILKGSNVSPEDLGRLIKDSR